ncbi:hypothetical protein TRFO_42957 [Tritrichomonas foetus]|uniref:Nucleotide-diphospho-sugar transferase domain-containing protein n=1 Tax=Tritrichomonas foetus TaxID=1144522 RepID=A0A1J4KYG8_9EUKA|nr:hypothetical protein TRFO_42957 [Tritrichomonas foetus]|eukprot:OHT14605.1 hypothetical protein TRFO_42957 [Tritrichomonas foetus]
MECIFFTLKRDLKIYLFTLFLIYLFPKNHQIRMSISSFDDKILAVTAYFPLQKSKHLKKDYLAWINNLLRVFQGPLVIFTNHEGSAFLKLIKKQFCILTMFSDPFSIPCMKNLSNEYERQNKIDIEKKIHNKFMYAIWNSKICLVNEAKLLFPFFSFYMWIDIGSLREKHYYNISIPRGNLSDDLIALKFDILFACINNKINRFHDMTIDFIEGGFFICSNQGVDLFYSEFWRIHNFLLQKHIFVGKDQTLYNYLFFNSNYSIKILPLFASQNCNKWFGFYSFISSTNVCNLTFQLFTKKQFLETTKVKDPTNVFGFDYLL